MTAAKKLREAADNLRAIVGDEAALTLMELYGGTRLYVPKNATPASKLYREIGEPALAALCEEYSSCQITVPLGREWRASVYHALGASNAEIARALGCSIDGVRFMLIRAGANTGKATKPPRPNPQLDLFRRGRA